MAQTSRPCKGCGEPIYRTVAVAPIKHYHGPDCRPRCSVNGCEKPRHGDVYCSGHHTRWKRTGDPLTPLTRQPNVGACTVEGCDRPMRKRKWCADHYGMWRRFGEIREWSYRWGDGGYVPTHRWLRRELGAPEQYPCVDCGGTAQEWSYDNQDPDELIDLTHDGAAYTRKTEHYQPRCCLCHRRFDRAHRTKRNAP